MATFYLEALASYYDPHTTYFSEIEQQNFEEELSKDKKAYGFSMTQNAAGHVLIAGLIPGSAAWMSGQMSVGDQIIEVKFEGGKKLDVQRMDANSLSLEFDNATAQSMVMTLKKPNGNIEEVHLTKAEIYVDQDVIKSVILEGEKKVGYIILPDFYTDWDNYNGLGCANDVAKNLVKLKQENIDGLILDLRNNGGGSLKEAMDLAGIFINYGPITIETDKYSEGKTLKDMNRGAIYTGPLVILVNGLSASASEIFSAAMQDYNRAIIVGSQTYGKSTGQVILPLDPTGGVDPSTEMGMGYLKVTTSKFYRVNKTTHQKEGLKPDIVLRDFYELYDYAEANYPNAIGNDKIEKKIYYTPAAPIDKSILKSSSDLRMKQNENYQKLCEMIDTIEAFKSYYQEVPLHIASYQKNEKKMNTYYSTLWDNEEKLAEQFEVINNKYDLEIMKINDFRSKLNDEYLENVAKDLYIGEAYNIILDHIKSK
jgi:carboxyl-terminal processing protease